MKNRQTAPFSSPSLAVEEDENGSVHEPVAKDKALLKFSQFSRKINIINLERYCWEGIIYTGVIKRARLQKRRDVAPSEREIY